MKNYLPAALLFLSPLFSEAQKTLAIKNVSLIDVKANKLLKHETVVIRENKILFVGNRNIPKTDTAVDATGKFLVPGLWDMHAHTLTDHRYVYSFPLLIANGVTGVREMASNLPIGEINQLRQDVESGKMLGPRFGAVAYRLLDAPGTQFSNVAVLVTTPEQGRELVRTYKQDGADFMKPYNLLSREVYLAIMDEAKKQHIPLEGHVPFSMSAAEVSDLGQRSIEHMIGVFINCSKNQDNLQKQTLSQPNRWAQLEAKAAESYDTMKARQLFKKFIRNETWMCPTNVLYATLVFNSDSILIADPSMQYVPVPVKNGWHETYTQRITKAVPDPVDRNVRYEMRLFITGEMHRAGVHLMAGTDMPNPYVVPGFSLHRELELFVQSGLTPIEALRTATLYPARFLRKEKYFGTVEKGKFADLLLLDANPLENISNTKKIFAVIANGKLLLRKDLDHLLTTVEENVSK